MKYNSYDRIASYYDYLSLVLGRAYRKSKNSFLSDFDQGDLILYVGGGTGANLVEMLRQIGDEGEVCYVEASFQMIERAKNRVPTHLQSRISFINESDFSKIPLRTFDRVITQYFLDILSDQEILKLFQEISFRTDKNSQWIFVDFFEVKGRRWLVKSMILFFRAITHNPRKELPEYRKYFDRFGWQIEKTQLFNQGFIQAWMLEREDR